MSNLIYRYIKVDTNETVYVGRTNNLPRRRMDHEEYEPYQMGRSPYNYPLSRGIRKYGVKNYRCEVVEDNLTYEESLERERYWIKYYNTYNDPSKYNQTPGGEIITEPIYSDEVIEQVKKMLELGTSFKEIQQNTGISLTHISEINTGKRRRDDNHTYPINSMTCGRKLNSEQVLEIIALLQQGKLSNREIGIKYNVCEGVITKINLGKSYKQKNIDYPIRSRLESSKRKQLSEVELQKLIEDITKTNISFPKLAAKYGVGTTTIYNINNGTTRKQPKLIYPLRKI